PRLPPPTQELIVKGVLSVLALASTRWARKSEWVLDLTTTVAPPLSRPQPPSSVYSPPTVNVRALESSIRQADENIAIAERELELKRENRAQLQAKLDAARQSERA